jgi:hypothetical protein
MRSLVQILALKQSDRFSGIPQLLESSAGIVSQIKPWLLPSTSLGICYSIIIAIAIAIAIAIIIIIIIIIIIM